MPLREGGSLPALVEADDDNLYVLKFRGAGQGPRALVAEVAAGELARKLGFAVPEIVFVDVDAALGRNEPDQEIQDLLRASVGRNVGLDYLPGSVMFDRAAGDQTSAEFASALVWLDAWLLNVDRTVSNANLLLWHAKPWLIDHGAALYFHHDWERAAAQVGSPFAMVARHVLLPWATAVEGAKIASEISWELVKEVFALVPEEWMNAPVERYADFLMARREHSALFEQEAARQYALLV
jgi:hypothetical protein